MSMIDHDDNNNSTDDDRITLLYNLNFFTQSMNNFIVHTITVHFNRPFFLNSSLKR